MSILSLNVDLEFVFATTKLLRFETCKLLFDTTVRGECYLVSGEEGEVFGNRATDIL